jgi:hypothetical protein
MRHIRELPPYEQLPVGGRRKCCPDASRASEKGGQLGSCISS